MIKYYLVITTQVLLTISMVQLRKFEGLMDFVR